MEVPRDEMLTTKSHGNVENIITKSNGILTTISDLNIQGHVSYIVAVQSFDKMIAMTL